MKSSQEIPSEIALILNRLTDKWKKTLLNKNREYFKNEIKNDLLSWYKFLNYLIFNHDSLPQEIWAALIKTAWLFADIEFFKEYGQKINTELTDSISLIYYGIAQTEFFNFQDGFTLIEQNIDVLNEKNDWLGLLEVSTAYALILNNSEKIDQLISFKNQIDEIFLQKFHGNKIYQHLTIPITQFMHKKDKKIIIDEELDYLTIAIEGKDNLIIGLTYIYYANLHEDTNYIDNMKKAIYHFNKINAKQRLLIAYTNLASHYTTKQSLEMLQEYTNKAINLADEISPEEKRSQHLYPYLMKGYIELRMGHLHSPEALFKTVIIIAEKCSSKIYLVKSYHGLAQVYFLLNQNKLAIDQAETAFSYCTNFKDGHFYKYYLIEHIDLLIELNHLDNINNYLNEINLYISDLDSCIQIYFNFVKSKFELKKRNIGTAKEIISTLIPELNKCKKLHSTILLEYGEILLHEFRLSEDHDLLLEAQKVIERGLERIEDIPSRIKGEYLSAILFTAQKRYDEAEELLESLISNTKESVPRFLILAEKLLDNIRDTRSAGTPVSPMSNLKEVIQYLQDAKSVTESQPR
ncbi:hypothetical protein [Candidatus Hodarchaeum mangrovi]